MNSTYLRAAAAAALLALGAGCQTTSQSASAPPAESAATMTAETADGTPAASTVAAASATPGVCAPGQLVLAGGPPPKPARTADLLSGTAENVGRNVARNTGTRVAQNIFARAIPGVGGAVAVAATPAVAGQVVQRAEDLWDDWKVTEGTPTCGCTLTFSKSAFRADLASSTGCTRPQLQQVARWSLGKTFTGYDAPLTLYSANGAVVARLNREGFDYFQGALADGTPVVLWRE